MIELIENFCADCEENLSDYSFCVNDTPDVHFRIGIWDGPLILYSRESDIMHNLLMRDLKGNTGIIPIPKNSESYKKLAIVVQRIHILRKETNHSDRLLDESQRELMDKHVIRLVNDLMSVLRFGN